MPEFTKFIGNWNKLEGGETSAVLKLNEPTQVGTYTATLLDTIRDKSSNLAIIEFNRKDSIKMELLEGGRYDIEDGNCIFVQSIVIKPEKFVNLHVKGKKQ